MIITLLLALAAFVAAAISGAAGFGGALLLLPLLVAAVGTQHAVPLLTVVQLIGNLSRAGFGFSQIKWKPVGLFLIGAIPFSMIGAFLFIDLPKELITRCIGAAILIFIILKLTSLIKLNPGKWMLIIGGSLVGLLSGLVGSAGPLGAVIFLSLGLPPVAYIASEATTALAMHFVKTLIYQTFISLDQQFWILGAVMGISMVLGTWVSKKFIEKLSPKKFQIFVAILLILISIYMILHG